MGLGVSGLGVSGCYAVQLRTGSSQYPLVLSFGCARLLGAEERERERERESVCKAGACAEQPPE